MSGQSPMDSPVFAESPHREDRFFGVTEAICNHLREKLYWHADSYAQGWNRSCESN
jgi:hypothetical protein